jgi:hypothetical protein
MGVVLIDGVERCYETEDQKEALIAYFKHGISPFEARKRTIYQCLDGAMVIEHDGLNPKRSTMDEALLKFKDSPVIKLNDMTLEMVENFISQPAGSEALKGVSPLYPQEQHIPFDRDSPHSYSLITLVAMAAAFWLAQLQSHSPDRQLDWDNSLVELMMQIANIKLEGRISPYE